MWDLPGPGIKPVSPVLQGGFLTTRPPGKPLSFPEENNRIGKTKELLKKTGVIKEMFQARMGMIKDEMVRT